MLASQDFEQGRLASAICAQQQATRSWLQAQAHVSNEGRLSRHGTTVCNEQRGEGASQVCEQLPGEPSCQEDECTLRV